MWSEVKMAEQKVIYSGVSENFFTYKNFLEFWQKRTDARCVVQDNDSLTGSRVKIQVWHVDPGVSVFYDDRIYVRTRHVMVTLHGDIKTIETIEDIIANEASKYVPVQKRD